MQRKYDKIFLDKEGRWFHEGVEVTHERTIELFNRSIVLDDDGRYFLVSGRDRAPIEVEDAPYRVLAVDDETERPRLSLSDGTVEFLDPSTLFISEENVLYCRVKEGRMKARFSRPAYYRLLQELEEGEGGYYVRLAGRRWRINMTH